MFDGVRRMTRKVWTHPANEGRRVRQLAAATRFQIRSRLTHRPLKIHVGERSRLWASLDSSSTILAAYARVPDYVEWSVWRRFLNPEDLFVDVGSNVGLYSVLAHEREAEIIAVEPHPDNVARLHRNLELNGAVAEVHELALSDTVGTIRFSSDLDSENRMDDQGSLEVQVDTFDRLIGDRVVAGVKIDVEGAERQVLAGARRALSEGRIGLLQIEWNHTARENFGESREPVAELLASHGYALFRPGPAGALRPSSGAEGSDMFAARPETITQLVDRTAVGEQP
jgi:FkbM family methyltransferase